MNFKDISISPLTGLLNNQSLPEFVKIGEWRERKNWQTDRARNLCRRPQWERLFPADDPTEYQNADLHFHGDGINGSPITALYESVSTTGARRLIAATQNYIYLEEPEKGLWILLGGKYGGNEGNPHRRFHIAQVNDKLIFTNGIDPVQGWIFGNTPSVEELVVVNPVENLFEIGVTSAGTCASWKGIMFLADVVMEGISVPHRIVWSNLDDAFGFIPDISSVSGFNDLTFGSKILRMMPLGNYLVVYTDHGVWLVTFVGGQEVFSFRQVYYEPSAGEGCLVYPFTLVNIGDYHFFMGREYIYAFSPSIGKPKVIEWIDPATSPIFKNINKEQCYLPTAGYSPENYEYWLSWVKDGDVLPSETLVCNVKYQACDFVDHGFTAFAALIHDTSLSVGKFLTETCVADENATDYIICSKSELDADEYLLTGLQTTTPCPQDPVALGCAVINDNSKPLFTNQTIDLDGLTIEDYEQEEPTSDSFCSDIVSSGIIEDTCNNCKTAPVWILASASDYSLKQEGGVMHREVSTVNASCGIYTIEGYDSILRSGPIGLNSPDRIKLIDSVLVEYEAAYQTVANMISLRVGWSSKPVDPNLEQACGIQWLQLSEKELKCPTQLQYGTKAANKTRWGLHAQAHYIYIELKLSGTGGSSCWSRIDLAMSVLNKSINY